jgi:molecular chaperone DnaJ
MADEVRREWFEKDYYAVLGVPKNASDAEIRKAYRKLAQQHHPDTKQGDPQAEERFKEITAAYDVLGDAEKRTAYDRVREMGASGFGPGFGGAGWPGGATGGWPGGVRYEHVDVDDISDLFGGLFGGGGRRGGRRGGVRRGADLETQITADFEDAIAGTTVPVRIDGPAVCSRCRGSGAEPGTTPVTCPQCGGRGEIAENQGFFSMSRPCPRCGGAGRIVEAPCTSCGGSGAERRTRTLQVRIPSGIRDGARIRVVGKGEPGPAGAPPGDLYVKVAVRPHPVFGRRGDDLTVDLPITYPEAALGANVEVPTLNGPVTLKIPAGTPTGKTFRVRGRGAPRRGGRGDLLAKVHVDVPTKLSREQKELVKQLREAQAESPRARLGVERGGGRGRST